MHDFRHHKVAVSLISLLLVFCATYALGQGIVTGSISGTVVDQHGAVIPGAKVIAKSAATNQEFTDISSGTGAFAIRGLPPGNYMLTITAPNFQTLEMKDVVVKVGVDTALGARTLPVGPATESIVVETAPPMVETTTSQISTTFANKQVTDLPLAGGGTGFDELALLIPGSASTGDAGFSNTNGAGISMNGQRGRSNNFQIDGQSNNDNSVAGPSLFLGNQDIIAEYQVVTNNFSAEYGRNMGSVVNYITKSGSNAFHGTAFEFYTGSFVMSKRNQEKSELFGFCGATPTPGCETPTTPRYVENRWGGTIGGPILKDKAWFFASMMNDRARAQTLATSGSAYTPDPAGLLTLENTFCGTAYTTYTPDPCPTHPGLGSLLMNGPYANPAGAPRPIYSSPSTFTQTVTAGLITSAPITLAPVSRFLPNPYDDWEATGRVDWQITSKDRVFARYLFQDLLFTVYPTRVAAGAWMDNPGRTQQIGLDWVHSFSDHFLNQVRFSYSRARFAWDGQSAPGAAPQFANCNAGNIGICPTGVQFSDNSVAFGFANNMPQSRLINNSQWQDNMSWVHGKHTFKMGGEYDRQRSPNDFLPNINGTFTYANIDNLVSNIPTSMNLSEGVLTLNFKEQDAAAYFQDDWRIKDNLTLNLGVRWEYTQQAINMLHNLTMTRESNPATAFWLPTIPMNYRTVPNVPNDFNNFGPNLGFAYTPRFWEGLFGKDKTTFRGGFRIAYDPAFYNMFLNVATSAPTVNAASFTGAPILPGTTYNGAEIRTSYAALFVPGAIDPRYRSTTTVSPDFHNPYTEQYSLGVERAVTEKIAFEIRYVGNHGVGNFQSINANPNISFLFANFPSLVPGGFVPCPTGSSSTGLNRIDCNHRLVRQRDNGAWSNYNALQTRLSFQNWHGFTAQANYTWSRALDNVSEIFSTGGGGVITPFPMNPFDPNVGERGVSATNYPHVVSLWFTYQLPWYQKQEGLMGHVLGGWQLNGVYLFRTGQAFTPANVPQSSACDSTFENSFAFPYSACRPILFDNSAPLDTVAQCTNVVGCVPIDYFTGAPVTTAHWLINDNIAALFLGNPFQGVGRNTLTGQTVNNIDFGVYKNTKVSERFTLQFQANAYNLFNRQYRGVPDPLIDDFPLSQGGSFMNNFFNGSGNRYMTFGLKLIF